MDFLTKFKAAHSVSTPLVTVRTFDAKSTIERIKASFKEGWSVIVWDCVQGLFAVTKPAETALQTALTQSGTQKEATSNIALALYTMGFVNPEGDKEDSIIFMHNAHLHWTDAQTIQGIWNLRDKFKARGNTLVLLTGNGAILPPELANDFLVLDEPLPTQTELETIVNDTFVFAKLDKPSEDVLSSATKALIGLPAFPAEQVTAMCLDVPNKKLDISELWDRKRQAINQTRGLSVLKTDADLNDIGGLAQFKQYLEQVMNGKDAPNVILLWDEIEKAFAGMGTDTSGTTTKMGGNVLSWSQDTGMRGAIGVGVPGCGKTEIAKAIANKYGKLCISFNLADMESGIVGSSNENLRSAMAVIDAVSDKKVLSIATCNKIDTLTPEIKRRFATEAIFFFDAPTHEERTSIWNIYRTKYGIDKNDSTPQDEGWTGAEIKNCVLKAYRLNISLKEAANYIVPVTVSDAATIESLRRYCSHRFLSASYPGMYTYDHANPVEPSVPEISGRKIR